MSHHQRRINAAYPHLLPGFFTLTDDAVDTRPIRVRLPHVDASTPPPPKRKSRGRRKQTLAYRRAQLAYFHECAAAISVLFRFADVVQAGDAVVVTTAMSADDFDLLSACGAALEDWENDDPLEDGGDAEPDSDGEDCDRDLPFAPSAKEIA
jgi:hypothetical protein